jgi:hypothetical protein
VSARVRTVEIQQGHLVEGVRGCNCDASCSSPIRAKVSRMARMVLGQGRDVQRMPAWGTQVGFSHCIALLSHHTTFIMVMTWRLPSGVDVVCQCCVRLLRKVRLSDEAMPRVFVREGRKLGNGISGEARMSNCVMVCQAPAGFGEFGRYDVIRYVRRRSALQSAQVGTPVGTHKWASADRCDDIG